MIGATAISIASVLAPALEALFIATSIGAVVLAVVSIYKWCRA